MAGVCKRGGSSNHFSTCLCVFSPAHLSVFECVRARVRARARAYACACACACGRDQERRTGLHSAENARCRAAGAAVATWLMARAPRWRSAGWVEAYPRGRLRHVKRDTKRHRHRALQTLSGVRAVPARRVGLQQGALRLNAEGSTAVSTTASCPLASRALSQPSSPYPHGTQPPIPTRCVVTTT